MDKKRAFTILAAGLILMACAGHLLAQSTLDTALTYEGFLKTNNRPVNRMMDLRFTLFADPNATQQIGGQLEAIGVDVVDGHFAMELDFGAAPFTGEPRWLQTELRRNDRPDDPYIPQTPLLRLTLSPYAIYANRARSAYALDAPDNSPTDAVIVDNDGNVGIGTNTPAEKLSVNGTIETTAGGIKFPDGSVQTTAVIGGGDIPPGGIIMWSGRIAEIPDGWALCDGNNGTPNLTDKFVIHADSDSGGIRNVGEEGGAHTHRLTVEEMPSHKHNVRLWWYGGGEVRNGQAGTGLWAQPSSFMDVGDYTGGGQAHNNMPKYYALAFIMKL